MVVVAQAEGREVTWGPQPCWTPLATQGGLRRWSLLLGEGVTVPPQMPDEHRLRCRPVQGGQKAAKASTLGLCGGDLGDGCKGDHHGRGAQRRASRGGRTRAPTSRCCCDPLSDAEGSGAAPVGHGRDSRDSPWWCWGHRGTLGTPELARPGRQRQQQQQLPLPPPPPGSLLADPARGRSRPI